MTPQLLAKAYRHLARRDPVMKRLRAMVGPCTLQLNPDPFPVLAKAIVSQLISTKAAQTIFGRLALALPDGRVTPQAVLALEEGVLRGVGLSGAKALAIRDLAACSASGVLPLAHFGEMTDDEVIGHLVQVRGIGRWTAEMFLIFSLGRPDVLPVDDLGLRAGVKEQYGLEELPKGAALRALAEPWRPYRSVATWYFWKSRGWVPQSEK